MNWLDYLMLVLFVASMVAIAIYTKNKAKSSSDFLMAGKKGLNGWMSAFAYGTTYFSAVVFIGYAGNFGLKFGLSAVWIGIFNALLGALVAWLLMAKSTKNMTTRLSVKTMPSFFEKRYESNALKICSAVIIFVFLIPYGASVYNGLGVIFNTVFNIQSNWLAIVVILALALITALYLCFGGYLATSLSDFVQGCIMLVGVLVMLVCFITDSRVGSEGIKSLFESEQYGLFETEGGIFGSTVSLISLILLTSVGVYGLPQTVHKYYTVRDKKAIKQGVIISTLFALIVGFVAYFTGALGSLFNFSTNGEENMSIMIAKVIPSGLLGLIVVLLLSASMSTLGSVSLSSSSVISVDLYKGVIKKDATDKQVTWAMRIMCFIFIAISAGIAIWNTVSKVAAISSLMSLSWGTLSGCFIGPFVLGLKSKKITKKACFASIIGTLVITVTLIFVFGTMYINQNELTMSFGNILQKGCSQSALIGVICMAYSFLSTWIVSMFTKKPSQETINLAFDSECEGIVE